MDNLTEELSEVLVAIEQGWVQSFGNALLYRCADGEALCGVCVVNNRDLIKMATIEFFTDDRRPPSSQWAVIGIENTAEYDDLQQCVHCHRTLE